MTMKPPVPIDEKERIDALHRYKILDTIPEKGFDDLTLLAAQVCQVPISIISLVDEKRVWFKSKLGLSASQVSRDVAFCAYAILERKVFVVPNALRDPRFSSYPSVVSKPRVRFYAGAPLVSDDNHAIGALCVIDYVPRRLNEKQLDALRALSRQVVAQMELRRNLEDLRGALADVRVLRGLLPICAWCKRVRDDDGYWTMVETYVADHSNANFTHGICPECTTKHLTTHTVRFKEQTNSGI